MLLNVFMKYVSKSDGCHKCFLGKERDSHQPTTRPPWYQVERLVVKLVCFPVVDGSKLQNSFDPAISASNYGQYPLGASAYALRTVRISVRDRTTTPAPAPSLTDVLLLDFDNYWAPENMLHCPLHVLSQALQRQGSK